ncbi:MAG: hypothetical protein JSV05_08835, partial [Candidatus Bathyarchaeota archaeon]
MSKKKEEDLLKELCGDDAELHDVLESTLHLDPIAALHARRIFEKDLAILIGEAEKSIKEKNYEEATVKYELVVDKALFEATQNPGERSRYIKVLQDSVLKALHATEKVKEKVEEKGQADYPTSFERRIKHYEIMSKRIEDVVNVAAHFYNEKLAMLKDVERRAASRDEIQTIETEEAREIRGEAERREARQKARKEMGREARREAEKEEKRIREREKERRVASRERIKAIEQEERQAAWGDKEKREARRKKRREARQK